MSMQDPISDMMTRIRNAQTALKPFVKMPSSKFKIAIAKVLLEEGYIADISFETTDDKPTLKLALKYFNEKPVIARIRTISRPGLRVYAQASELPVVMEGLGIAIVSTSKGVMSAKAARQLQQGGEVLCEVA
jgi:small subunit ribosomal protein S8